jgi:hypothetical protein
VKYDFTKEEYKNLLIAELKNRDVQFSNVDFVSSLIVIDGLCFELIEDPRFFKFDLIEVDCPPDSGGGGSSTNSTGISDGSSNGENGSSGNESSGSNEGVGNNGSNGSNGNNNSNGGGFHTGGGHGPILTTPVLATDGEQVDPCVKMKKLSIIPVFNQKLAGITYAAQNYSFESLNTFYQTSPTNYTAPTFNGTINSPEVVWTGNNTMQGMLHSHYSGLLSIFSPKDLQDLYNIMSDPDVTDEFFYGVVTHNGYPYIITISDRAAFLAFGSKYLIDNKFKDFEMRIYNSEYHINLNHSDVDNEINFIKMTQEKNMGITVMSKTPNTPNWKKLTYSIGSIVPVDCN